MSTSVFISSTSKDLKKHRASVAQALRNAGYHPIDMLEFMSRPTDAVQVCLEEIADADLFVGIYAWRYGFIPDNAEASITEQEYDEAQRLGKPCFCFIVDEDYIWPEEFFDSGIKKRLLADFKARIDSTVVRTLFTTPDDLAIKTLASLQRWNRNKGTEDVESILHKARESIISYEFDGALNSCKKILETHSQNPIANLLIALALMENKGADKIRSNVIARIEKHLNLSAQDPSTEATALTVLGIIKYDHFVVNGLYEGEPKLSKIINQLQLMSSSAIDYELIQKVKASPGAIRRLNIE